MGPELTLTESESLVLRLLLVWSLTVDRGDVSLLTAIVAAPAVAHPAATHWREDDLDAVQVGREVGSWKTHTHLDEKEQRQRVPAGNELHPSSVSFTVTHSPSGQSEVYKCVRVCANNWPVACWSGTSNVPLASKWEKENSIKNPANVQALYLWERVFWMCVWVNETKRA